MKNRIELMNISAMTNSEVVGITAVFDSKPGAKRYTYKCPKAVADTLIKGDLALARYWGEVQQDRPVVSVIVHEVLESFDPDDMALEYRWIFGRVPVEYLASLEDWDKTTADSLYQSQRKRARQAVMQEILGGLEGEPLSLPVPPSDSPSNTE